MNRSMVRGGGLGKVHGEAEAIGLGMRLGLGLGLRVGVKCCFRLVYYSYWVSGPLLLPPPPLVKPQIHTASE